MPPSVSAMACSAEERAHLPDPFCTGHAKFTDGETTRTYLVQGEAITLRHHPDVFPPSAFGLQFGAQVQFRGCDRAADIGSGTGLLAILAGRKGVLDVVATDTSERAVRLTERNARELNDLSCVSGRCGSFFAGVGGTFDVITANLPQEIIPPNHLATLSASQASAIDGLGPGGNAILLEFLDIAPAHMHERTRLYVIVNTITDHASTLRKIDERYAKRLLWRGLARTKDFVRDNIPYFRGLMAEGTISIAQDEKGVWFAHQYIYELRLKR